MANLKVDIDVSSVESARKRLEEFKQELKAASGIQLNTTNSEAVAKALLANEVKFQAQRRLLVEKASLEQQTVELKLLAERETKTKLSDQKISADRDALQAKLNASRLSSQEALAAKQAALETKLATDSATKRALNEQRLAANRDELELKLNASAAAQNEKLTAQKLINDRKLNQQRELASAKEERLAANAANSLFGKFGNVRNVIGSITQAALAASAAMGAAFTTERFLAFNKSIESASVRIKNLFGGSNESIAQFDKNIAEVAAKSNQSLSAIRDSAVKLKTFGIEPTVETLLALSDGVAKAGGNSEVFDGVVRALTQSLAKGKLQQEEVNQLAERGIPAQKLLADAMGITTSELISQQAASKVGRKEIELLIKAIGADALGAGASQIGTLGGSFTKLTDGIEQAAQEIGKGGLNKAIADIAKDITTSIQGLIKDGSLKKFGADVANSLKFVVENVKSLGGVLSENATVIKSFISVFAGFKVVSIATGALGGLVNAFGVLGKAAGSGVGFIASFSPHLKLLAAGATAAGLALEYFNNKQVEIQIAQQNADVLKIQKDKLAEISDQTGINIQTITGLNAAIALNTIRFNELTGAYESTNTESLRFKSTISGISESELTRMNDALALARGSLTTAMQGGVSGAISLKDALSKITDDELLKLKTTFSEALDVGIIKSEELTNQLNAIDVERTNRLFKELGLTSSDELQRIADSAGLTIEKMKELNVPTSDLAKAYAVFAEKAIAANKAIGGNEAILASQLKQKASQDGINLSIDETGKITSKVYGQMSKDIESVVSSGNKVVDSLQRQQESVNSYVDSLRNRLNAERAIQDQARAAYEEEQQRLFEKSSKDRDVQIEKEKATIAKNLEKIKADSESKSKVIEPTDTATPIKPQTEAKTNIFTPSQSSSSLVPVSSKFNIPITQPQNNLFTVTPNRDNIADNGTLSATIIVNIDSVNILKSLQNVKLNRN